MEQITYDVRGVAMSDYILTYTKKKFFLLDPNIEDIDILDIAHALSLKTRANGHFKHFYSVAQHSINCYKEAQARKSSERVQLGCLLHDASESYISDINRPVKKHLHAYFSIEKQLQQQIYKKFGLADLTQDEIQQVSDIDDALLYYEFKELMEYEVFEKQPSIYSTPEIREMNFRRVEKEFLSTFNKLMGMDSAYSCIGIDVCNGKWVVVYISNKGFDVKKYGTIDEICRDYPNCNTYIIDIPIGLPESNKDIRPDSLVKKLLGRKGSSIFDAPCRQAIYAANKGEAREQNIKVMGKSLSEQSIGIAKAIKQVDEFLKNNPEWNNKLIESHPEFCFMKFNKDIPIYENKKTIDGQKQRLDILRQYYPHSDAVIEKFLSDVPYRKKTDDVIDALCLAIMGKEIKNKGLKTVPENSVQDSKGLIMQMVYAE